MSGAYHWRADPTSLAFDTVTDQAVAANSNLIIELADATYPSGLLANAPFSAHYEGAITFDTSRTDNYRFRLIVEHIIGDVEFTAVHDLVERVNNAALLTVPLNTFDSISRVRLGAYTDANGDTIQITQDLLDADAVRMVFSMEITNARGRDFTCTVAGLRP